ncbi:peptidoglycan recognition protein-like isoform X1 [Neodiprion virginianus]|uniref:peptidoglycan recognition protein-like isoform X1 n=1 Tax=Neodiprion virginianus TaxID=2961670 RepID=UPI001EE7515B|nr:peptidoglycan recognition protein-like isoform X1 [Neodiprion virginianus]
MMRCKKSRRAVQSINTADKCLKFFEDKIYQTHECPNIITRSQWGARQVASVNYLIVPIPYVVIHHTAGHTCNRTSRCAEVVAGIQAQHIDSNNWGDIGYSFLIGGDGNVYEGKGWTREGAHVIGYNKKSIGIAFIGSFEDNNANQTMLDVAHKLIICGKAQGILRPTVRVVGARQLIATVSPGFALYNQIQAWPEWVSTP